MLLLLARYLDASRPLDILDCTPTSAQVALSLDELVILNEAANGVHISDWEFATCVGSNRAEVQTLLCAVGD